MFLQSLDISRSISTRKDLHTQDVVGFPISTLPFEAQVSTIVEWTKAEASRVVCVSNVHMLMEGIWHSDFAQVLRGADLLTPDGMPLVWMARLLGKQTQERVAGMELMLSLCDQAQANGISIFFYGSRPETLSRIRQRLAEDYPALKVAGMHSPPFRSLSAEEDTAITQEINSSGAKLVFVALGCPKQETWMHEHREQIQGVMIGLGGAFSVYTGEQKWAPVWIRELGLEWLYRLLQEPQRLWKRYVTTIPPFLWLALKQVIRIRLRDPWKNSKRRQQ